MKSVVMLFPGQGSQYPGMGLDYFTQHPVCRDTFLEADEALHEKLSETIFRGAEESLTQTANAQPAILTVSVAIGRWLMQERGVRPVAMAGHSLGEYSALVLSQAMDFPSAIRAVRARGRFMQEAVPLGEGTMAAILGADDAVVEKVCEEISAQGHTVEPANYNCPGQLVISGSNQGVALASAECKARGALKTVPLKVSAPFHSSMLRPAGDRLAQVLSEIRFLAPKIPYLSNVTAEEVRDADSIAPLLAAQVWKPVKWAQSLGRLVNQHPGVPIVECGPGKVLSGHVKKIERDRKVYSTDPLATLDPWFLEA